jgi:hypothetical protein
VFLLASSFVALQVFCELVFWLEVLQVGLAVPVALQVELLLITQYLIIRAGYQRI